MTEGTPCAVKAACTVWSGGKPGDNLKGLPITIATRPYVENVELYIFDIMLSNNKW